MAQSEGWINLGSLSAQVDGNQLRLDYGVAPDSWDWVIQEGVTPYLNVQLPDGTQQNWWMEWRDGNATLTVPDGCDTSNVKVWLSGGNASWTVDFMQINGSSMWAADVPVTRIAPPPPPPPPPAPRTNRNDRNDRDGRGDRDRGGDRRRDAAPVNWAAQPSVIQACGDTFEGNTNELACLQAVASFRFDPTTTIQACDSAMEGDANELACVKAAGANGNDVAFEIPACEDAMEGDANELACITSVERSPADMRATIKACEDAMEGDANELACIAAATGGR